MLTRKLKLLMTSVAMAVAMQGCVSIGNMGSIKEALELAVDCKPDDALRALQPAEADGGLSAYMAKLEKVVVLRDAQRTSEAALALDEYMALPEVEDSTRADIEDSVQESLEELRKERKKQTGKANC